jgi:asparagine synthetase A
MHSITLNVKDEIYNQIIGLISILPHQMIEVESDEIIYSYPSLGLEKARNNVNKAIEMIPLNKGLDLDKAFDIAMGDHAL